METINTAVSCNCSTDLAANRSFQAAQTRLAALSTSRSMDLDLVTEEGDRVTLSIDTQASAIYAAYGEVGMDGDSFSGQWGEFSGGAFERVVAFTVDGDLNKEERREIRKVIKTLNRMMNDFVKGKLNPMVAKARKLEGLETIESLEVEMSYAHQALVAQQTEAATAYDRTGGATPDSYKPLNVVEVPVEKEAEVVAMEMAGEVAASPAPLDPMKELADRLLEAYRDRAAAWNALAGQVIDHIRDIFESALGGFESAVVAGPPSDGETA